MEHRPLWKVIVVPQKWTTAFAGPQKTLTNSPWTVRTPGLQAARAADGCADAVDPPTTATSKARTRTRVTGEVSASRPR